MTARRRRAAGRRNATRGRLWWLVLGAVVVLAAVVAGSRTLRRPWLPFQSRAGIELFFVRYSAGHAGALVAVRRAPHSGPVQARAKTALLELLAGPSRAERARGIVSEIPRGTRLLDVEVRGGTATVDLTGAFQWGGGSTSMLARLWQVVYTATQEPGIHSVQILIGGRRVEALGGEGVMIDRPIARPVSMPTF